MSESGYEVAFAFATAEAKELSEQIEQLTSRKALVEKVLESLTPLIPQHKPAEEPTASAEGHEAKAHEAEAHAHEFPAHEFPAHDVMEHEVPAHEAPAHHEG
jgi:hypothetical protein